MVGPARREEGTDGDVCVSGAPGVHEQAGVIGPGGRFRVYAEGVTQPHRGQRGMEAVLVGKAHPEIRGQAEGGDDLGGSDLPSLLLPHRPWTEAYCRQAANRARRGGRCCRAPGPFRRAGRTLWRAGRGREPCRAIRVVGTRTYR